MPRSSFASLALLVLLGCGPSMPPIREARSTADDEEDEDSYVDEEEAAEEEEGEEEDGGFVDEALLREEPAMTLGEATEVPGTGVTMRPPEGATPIPFGSGFLSMRHRVQISLVVAEGPASLLDAVRGQGSANLEPQGEAEEVTVAGQQGRIGRDRVRTQQGELERAWMIVHDGQRGLAVTATYEAGRSERVFPAIRESFAGLTWDRAVELDPARALGIEVGAVDGMTASHATTANVVLLGRGASFPPEPGQPVVTISPLPMQLASEQTARVCEQLVARMLPVPTSDIEHEGTIDDGPLPGCERLATAESDGQRLATYAALVFANNTPILVTGSAPADQIARYRRRFSAAARSVRPRS